MKNVSYKIEDTNSGVKAFVTLPEGNFTLNLNYHNGMNGRRVWTVEGNYPKDRYMISYEMGKLFIIEKSNNELTEGQIINHKAFGKGIITSVSDNTVVINFDKAGQKQLMKSILANFLI